MIKIKEVPNQC